MLSVMRKCKSYLFFQQNSLVLLSGRRQHSSSSSAPFFFSFLQSQLPTTRSLSTSSATDNNSFTVSYLINSCGLSQQQALYAFKIVQFETPSKPDSVLTLLKSYGFTNTHISKCVIKRPTLLLVDPDKTLRPKLEFFRSIGFSDPDIANILCKEPTLLTYSLNKKIIPSYAFLKTIVHTDANVLRTFKRTTWLLRQNPQVYLAPNIAVLQAHGVPDSIISKFITTDPKVLTQRPHRFSELVNAVKEMGFNPLKCTFVVGLKGLAGVGKSVWKTKVEVYKTWGWSEEDIRQAFLKNPYCMMISATKIMKGMDFFVNKFGYHSSLIAKNPIVLSYSLEKRVIPRCSILQVLISKGLIKKDCILTTMLVKPEKDFLVNYVTKFEEAVPEIMRVYQGKVNGLELPI